MTDHELYYATMDAESRWSDALKAEYGDDQYPDSRWDSRAWGTPEIASLFHAWNVLIGHMVGRRTHDTTTA